MKERGLAQFSVFSFYLDTDFEPTGIPLVEKTLSAGLQTWVLLVIDRVLQIMATLYYEVASLSTLLKNTFSTTYRISIDFAKT